MMDLNDIQVDFGDGIEGRWPLMAKPGAPKVVLL